MRIFANHAHVFPPSINAEGTIDRLLKLLDACGIERCVCFAPFPHQAAPQQIDPNLWLANELRKHSRLIGFGTLDLKRSDVRDQVRRAADLGFPGLKLHPNSQEFDILAPRALEAYAVAEELGLLISFHSGVHQYRIAHYNVLKFDEVAHQFPDLKFSLEHVGGWAFFNEAVAVITNNIPFPPVPGRQCCVYGGLTSVFTPHYNRLWYMPRERMLELNAQIGVEQLIFGLDFPYNLEENTKMGLRAIQELGLSETQQAMILGGNLQKALTRLQNGTVKS
jgi:predicted TIM-barrel fold metal-dependent hydrolase